MQSSDGRRLLICHLREARRRARAVAEAELLSLLEDLGGARLEGGPLAEQRGLFRVTMPASTFPAAVPRLSRLGYTDAVDVLEVLESGIGHRAAPPLRWRGRHYRLVRVYEEDPAELRERTVDRRAFLLATAAGVRSVRGYRGSGAALGRRGLPVVDARMLVNLLGGAACGVLLDPFAGAGGIVIEAVAAGWRCLSMDRDPALRFGLSAIGGRHCIADVCVLPLAPASVDAIATEPPYEPEGQDAMLGGLAELHRVLRPGGRATLLCAQWQAPAIRARAVSAGFQMVLEAPIDRKGLPVVVFAWQKPP
ncbi:MAG TPA: hypothetical protein VH916_11410 [Dehalococcoidia bacterium]|jgi:hypothetical protein